MKIQNPAEAPADYTAFFAQYTPYIQGLVVQLGIDPVDAEDVAADILVKFLERDGLNIYDPERVSDRTGERVTFKTYVNNHVRVQIRKRLDKQFRKQSRELSYDNEAATFLSGPDSTTEGMFDSVLAAIDMEALRAHLATIHPSTASSATLADVLDKVLETFANNDRNSVLPNFPELGERIQMSRNGARRWYRILEVEIRAWVKQEVSDDYSARVGSH